MRTEYFIYDNGEYIQIEPETLSGCLGQQDDKKIYYGDILSLKSSNYINDNFLSKNKELYPIASSRVCYSSYGECHIEGYVLKDGVKPIVRGENSPIDNYPLYLREYLSLCETIRNLYVNKSIKYYLDMKHILNHRLQYMVIFTIIKNFLKNYHVLTILLLILIFHLLISVQYRCMIMTCHRL